MMPLTSYYQTKKKATPDVAARILSDVANPLVIPPFVFGIIGLAERISSMNLGFLLVISTTFFTVFPTAFALFISYRRPNYSLDFPRRGSRTSLYGLSILSALAGSILLIGLFNSFFIRLATLVFFINIFSGFVINFRWKISVHSTALATGGLYLLLFGLTDSTGQLPITSGLFLLVVVLPLIIWSRYRLKVHSFFEIIGGVMTGFVLTALVFYSVL